MTAIPTVTRRHFLRLAAATGAALALPLMPQPAQVWAAPAAATEPGGVAPVFDAAGLLARPAGDPSFQPWWVQTHLATKLWPSAEEIDVPVERVEPGRVFRVEEPQDGYRLRIWDPRENRQLFIGAEAVGPRDTPFWADFSDAGRWIDVNLALPQHLLAMQGDLPIFRDLVTAGVQGRTKPGFYRIMRRVYNETMDSRTVPNATRTYLLKDVLYTQYFYGDGSAIHYNWWASTWGAPGSQGCLGMRMDGAKFMWEWAGIDTPLTIHS